MAMHVSLNVAREPVQLNLDAGLPKTFMLPIIDPANPDVHVVNYGNVAVFLSFGPNAAVGPGVPDNVVVGSGQVITLTTKPDVLSNGERHLVQGGDQAKKAGFTMSVTGWATKALTVEIYRGEASLVTVNEALSGSYFDQKGRARAAIREAPAPATVWSTTTPQPQTETSTAWPEGWPPT